MGDCCSLRLSSTGIFLTGDKQCGVEMLHNYVSGTSRASSDCSSGRGWKLTGERFGRRPWKILQKSRKSKLR